MSVLIITYDLRTPKDYHDFYEAIKAQGEQGKWWHYMASTWLLSTGKSPAQVVDAIQSYLEAQDSLFVCQLSPSYQGRLPKQAWDWINAELQLDFSGLATTLSALAGSSAPRPSNPFLDAGIGALKGLPDPPKK